MSSQPITWESLSRWERYYLAQSIGRRTVCLPCTSKAIDSMIAKGLIHGAGLKFGRYCEFRKLLAASYLIRELIGESAVADAGKAGGESS